jgi:hypothetical protein
MDHGEALALIIAASADETTKQRLADLSKAQSAHDMALRAAQDQAQVNARTVQEARQQVAAALEMAAANARRSHELDERERIMGEVNDSLNREKDSFAAIRSRVEAEHAAREAELRARSEAVCEREAAATRREQDLEARERDVIAAEAAYARKHDALLAALSVQ